MRALTFLTLLCFGCATVRVPVATGGAAVDSPGTIAPPVVELWLESSDAVPKMESAKAGQAARSAIAVALSQRQISSTALGARDAVLFVRERGVALTDARRHQQTWAKVGLVVGFVAVVAVVIIAAVAGHKSGKPVATKSAPATRPAPTAASAVRPQASGVPGPRARAPSGSAGPQGAAGAGPRARPVASPVPASPAPAPQPRVYVYGGYAPVPSLFDFQFYLAPRPLVLRAEQPPEDEPYPGAPAPPAPDDDAPPGDGALDYDAVAHVSPALQLQPISAPADFGVEERGYFSGAQTGLQLDLLDRSTGALLWSRAVEGSQNPLDAGELGSLLDEAFAGAPWAHRVR